MNKEILETLNLSPKKIRQLGKAQILEDKYVIKRTRKSKKELYEYLISRNFLNFPPLIMEREGVEVVEYIKSSNLSEEVKLEDMIYLLTVLHNKTTFYKEVDINDIKKRYEETLDNLRYLLSYYQGIQTMIEEEIYMSPANYYFILNISSVYRILNSGIYFIESWYQKIQNKKTHRFVLTHNNLSESHLLENDNLYFISWDKATFASPVNDLVNLIQNNFEYQSIDSMLKTYQSKYRLYEEEYLLLLASLANLNRIDFNKEEAKKMTEVVFFLRYLEKLDEFFSKQNPNQSQN